MIASAALPYVVPFVVFVVLLVLFGNFTASVLVEQWVRAGVMVPTIVWAVWRLRGQGLFRVKRWARSIAVGAAIFVIWIGPDVLWPSYRKLWLFQNVITGMTHPGTPSDLAWRQPMVLALRAFRAVIIVPVVEELFWRGWLMRWLAAQSHAPHSKPHDDFETAALGTYTPLAFWAVALLFAAEHGPYWDVGLAAGIVFNAWMVRTKSLGDLMLAHAVANACLSAYVVLAGRWEYWQ